MTRTMKAPQNVEPFLLDGIPLNGIDQKRMRRLRKSSDQTGLPIPDLISEGIDLMIATDKARRELPSKIVKFPRSS
jgi:hypothetical protein